MMLLVKLGAGVVAAGAGVAVVASSGGVAVARAAPAAPARAAVSVLADANTFDVTADGRQTRVRLVNIAAPSPASASRPGECLGPEAAAFVAARIPVGTPLRLDYAPDHLSRNLATATTPDGRMLNAEIVRFGFAQVTSGSAEGGADGEESTTLPIVRQAALEAATAKRGLFSPDIPCTVPGQVKTVLDLAARVPAVAPPGAHGADLHNVAAAATDARAAADELLWAFDERRSDITWQVLDQATRDELRRQVVAARDRVSAAEMVLREAASAAFNQESTDLAVQKENQRVARLQATARAAEARRLAQISRRLEAARQARAAAVKASRERDRESARDSRNSESDSGSRNDSDRRESRNSDRDSDRDSERGSDGSRDR